MTEQRPTYHAHSGTIEEHEDRIITPSRILPRYAGSPPTVDTLFLLPILESPQCDEPHTLCMQLVHLPDGLLGFCNTHTNAHCACCDANICTEHHHHGLLTFVDAEGVRHDLPRATLCETCAFMGSLARTALHTFRRLINEQRQVRS
jgi:hypothetical protein